MSIIIVDGKTADSKLFVKTAEGLGYAVEKINPEKATRQIVRVVLPRGHEEDPLFFKVAREFMSANNAYVHYVRRRLQEFLSAKEENPKKKMVAILVNMDGEMRTKKMRTVLDEEIGVMRILLTNKDPDEVRGYDKVIRPSGDDGFTEDVKTTLRIITSC